MLKSESIVNQGIAIFERLVLNDKYKFQAYYNLANGLHNRSILKWDNYGDKWSTQYRWYVDTIKDRLLAKYNYSISIENLQDCNLIAREYNNRANMLNESFRWIEANRDYWNALNKDPRNGVAAGGIIKQILFAYFKYDIQEELLKSIVPPLFKIITDNDKYCIIV